MNEVAQDLVLKLDKSRKVFRRTGLVLGIVPIGAVVGFYVGATIFSAFLRGASYPNEVYNIAYAFLGALTVSTPTLLSLAFTFQRIGFALRARIKTLKENIESNQGFDLFLERLKKDARALLIMAIVLSSIFVISIVVFLITKDIRINEPLGPGECCLNSDGTSPFYGPHPAFVSSAIILYLAGPYCFIMGVLSFIAASATTKRSKMLLALN